jgi:hypothetical protein
VADEQPKRATKPQREKSTTSQVLAEEIFGFNTWLLQIVEKLPRNHKFLLGDRMQTAVMNLMMAVVEATYTKDRAALLRGAQMNIEKLRFLFRLANHAGIVSHDNYEHAARQLDQIGRGVGGWRKAHSAQGSNAPATRSPVREVRDLSGAAARGEAGDPGLAEEARRGAVSVWSGA